MKSGERVSCLFVMSLLGTAILAPACESQSVAPWPYTVAANDAAMSDAGAADDAASDDASDQDASDAGGIAANYAPAPLRCDGGLCNTDNYSLCNVAQRASESRVVRPLSLGSIVVAMLLVRRRRRRKATRSP
jgi:hypothetical protein